MKRLICLMLVMVMLCVVSCALSNEPGEDLMPSVPGETMTVTETAEPSALATNGTYEGAGSGYGGELKVSVTISGGEITGLELISDHESSPVMTRVFPAICDRILEAKSPLVDTVSGATFTSFAVKTAVEDAASQAGLDFGAISMTTVGETPEQLIREDVKTGILIVGGGPAGLSAAISAKESGAENIIIVEKLDILSGNGKFNMNFFDVFNTEAQEVNDVEDSIESFIEDKADSELVDARVAVWAQGASEVDAWLRSFGVQLNYNFGKRNHMAEADAYAGEHIQEKMEEKVMALGVDVRTGTNGLDFIMDGNKVTGVIVEDKNGQYNIHADAVILATGGFSANKELLAKYAPGAETVETSNQMGATGDFVPLFEKYGFKTGDMDVLSVFKLILKDRRDLTGAGDGFILVNQNGKRFVDESSYGLPLAHTILEQEKVFYIYDHNLYESMCRLKKHNELGYHMSANTLDELAEMLGINADNLKASVDSFNRSTNGEADDPFRKEPFERYFKEEGPYYGAQVESAIHMTKGGVVANEKAQVLMVDDSVVEGLYAAGEVTATSGAYSAGSQETRPQRRLHNNPLQTRSCKGFLSSLQAEAFFTCEKNSLN